MARGEGGGRAGRRAAPPWLAPVEARALAAVLLVALATRLLVATVVPAPEVISDASGYDAAARRLVATGSYAFPVGRALWSDDRFREEARETFERMPSNAWSMPGYTVFLAGVYRVAGTGPRRLTAVRVAHAAIATLTLALLFAIGDAVLGRRAAWWGLAFAAIYPPGFQATRLLLTETVFTLLLAAQVVLMIRAARSRALRDYALLGTATAAATYVRPVAALVPGILLVFELVRALREPGRARALAGHAARFAVLGLAAAVLLAPWWLRNQRRYGAFIPTTSAAALPPVQGELLVRRLPIPDESYAQFALPALTGNDDHVYAVKVADRIRAIMPPAAPADRTAAQAERFRMLGRALTTPFTQNLAKPPILSWPFMMQVALLLLAAIGLWRHRDRAQVLLVAAVPLYIVAVHWQVSWLLPRYLYPAMSFLLVLAGGAFGAGPALRLVGRAPARRMP